jgi:hypothetical protein
MDGTSASTPIIAGMFALMNNERLLLNQPPLGFVNPLLYRIALFDTTAFNDITTGSNSCTSGLCCDHGFYAAVGWDPLTGLGTPKYDIILNHVLGKTTILKEILSAHFDWKVKRYLYYIHIFFLVKWFYIKKKGFLERAFGWYIKGLLNSSSLRGSAEKAIM